MPVAETQDGCGPFPLNIEESSSCCGRDGETGTGSYNPRIHCMHTQRKSQLKGSPGEEGIKSYVVGHSTILSSGYCFNMSKIK